MSLAECYLVALSRRRPPLLLEGSGRDPLARTEVRSLLPILEVVHVLVARARCPVCESERATFRGRWVSPP